MGAHPAATAPAEVTPVDRFATPFLAIVFVNVVGGMMWLAIWLTTIELFALSSLVQWIRSRV